jgi:hypothetical protein
MEAAGVPDEDIQDIWNDRGASPVLVSGQRPQANTPQAPGQPNPNAPAEGTIKKLSTGRYVKWVAGAPKPIPKSEVPPEMQ